MDQNLAHALRHALNEANFNAAAMVEETVAAWKDPAPANATTMTRSKLRKFTKKKKAWAEAEMGHRYYHVVFISRTRQSSGIENTP